MSAYTGTVREAEAQGKVAQRRLPVGVEFMRHKTVTELQVPLVGPQLDLGQIQDLVLQILAGQLDRVACAVGGAAGHGLPLIGRVVGIAEPAGNEPRVHVQRLGGDLGQAVSEP